MISKEEFKKLTKSEQKALKNELMGVIKSSIEKSKDSEALEALKLIKPSMFGLGGFVRSGDGEAKYAKFAALFEKKDSTIHEDVIFSKMKAGRLECNKLIKDIIKRTHDETQIKWIKFDPATGNYVCVKIGKDAPKDWTGYLRPINVEPDTPVINDNLL